MFRIISIPHSHSWQVMADWHGQMRRVFKGDLFACCKWVATQERCI